MAVPKLEVLVHTKVSIAGPSQTVTLDVRPPTADEKWTLKYFMLKYELDVQVGGVATYKMELIDQSGVTDILQFDSDSISGSGTKTVQRLSAVIGNSLIEPFPISNMTLVNNSFLRLTLTSDGAVGGGSSQVLNVFVTGLKRPI